MDETEKRVIRWRKQALGEKVKVSDDLLIDLKDSELITPEHIKHIDREPSPSNKVQKMLDFVVSSQEPTAFATLLFVLSKHQPTAVKDLEADLRMEKGLMEVEEEIQTEAKMLVHKKFGTSKRLCEADKKDIADLIAAKLQIQKEEWDREKGALNAELKKCQDQIDEKDKKSQSIAKILREFLKSHDKQLTTHAHGMASTSQVLQNSLDDIQKDMLNKVERSLKSSLDRVDKILSHRDQLMKERDKSLKAIRCSDDKLALDQEITKALEKAKQDAIDGISNSSDNKISGSSNEASSGDSYLVKRLNKKITDLEHQIMDQEEELTKLRSASPRGRKVSSLKQPTIDHQPTVNWAGTTATSSGTKKVVKKKKTTKSAK